MVSKAYLDRPELVDEVMQVDGHETHVLDEAFRVG